MKTSKLVLPDITKNVGAVELGQSGGVASLFGQSSRQSRTIAWRHLWTRG